MDFCVANTIFVKESMLIEFWAILELLKIGQCYCQKVLVSIGLSGDYKNLMLETKKAFLLQFSTK